jgi:hypothetical protein
MAARLLKCSGAHQGNVIMTDKPEYVLVSRPSGNLLGEYPTLGEAEAVRAEYVASTTGPMSRPGTRCYRKPAETDRGPVGNRRVGSV